MEDNKNLIQVSADGNPVLVMSAEMQIAYIETQIKRLKEQQDKIKAALIREMAECGIDSIKTDTLTISYVAPTTREEFCRKDFRQDFPELYDKYTELSPVAASVRIKVK